jgi:hypothetical protein
MALSPVEPLSITIPQSLEFEVAPLFSSNKLSLIVVFVVSTVVVVPFTVRFPAKVAFAPLKVTAVVGVEPDFITSSPLLFVKLPNVVPSSFRVTSAPPASRVMSPAESNVMVDPVTVSITGLVRVLLVSVAVDVADTKRASPPVLGRVSVLLALSE